MFLCASSLSHCTQDLTISHSREGLLLGLGIVIGIDTNIEVIVVSLTTWGAHHSPRAKPDGRGELPSSLVRQQ